MMVTGTVTVISVSRSRRLLETRQLGQRQLGRQQGWLRRLWQLAVVVAVAAAAEQRAVVAAVVECCSVWPDERLKTVPKRLF